MIASPDAFRRSLPASPYVGLLCQVYTVLVYLYGRTDGHDENAVHIAEHCLHEIAVSVAPPKWLRDGIRAEVLRDLGLPPGYTGPAIPSPFFGAAQALKKVGEALRKNARAQFPVVTHLSEQDLDERFQKRIEAERVAGLAFVKQEARRVRRELGL